MLGAKHFSVIECKNVKSSEKNFGYSKLELQIPIGTHDVCFLQKY